MEQIKDGWFREKNDLWPGQCFSLQVEQVLHHEKSNFQDILVIQTKSHGTALILDGIIQCTEHDEFAYQEMISFLPLCAHDNPEKVLIIGGGDGGVAKEVSKHPQVKEIVLVEIDEKVINASKKFLPFMAHGFGSSKLTVNVTDGFDFMRNHRGEFDVVITDSSDPVGPAINLFTEEYFRMLKSALKPNGVICSQAGTIWSQIDHIRETLKNCNEHFPSVRFAIASVPTYPTGQIGFIIASVNYNTDLSSPKYVFTENEIKQMKLRYYNAKIHSAAFVLPNFAKNILYST